ncbi:LuxR C-terminal-related transcriptional regulator [Mycobacterium colombiense]|uniref:LuxR C-terminal-related transcriptional regulator n=1 Tax=Mycobacterium colombiense TaxID=339268 RepID=UPI003AF97E15
MLASMSETDWSDLAVSELPTGTVTLLLADVEGSTRLWETQPDEMTVAVARLDQILADVVAAHDGVRPVEQGEGDSFVVAFARASDAVACALDLQRAPLAPIRLRIGINTGEVRLRDEGNYIGPTINRTARLRDLAHGGQTVLSGATELLVVDQLPLHVSLTDLGTHPLRDLPRPERVIQLCHPDLPNDFPPLRTPKDGVTHNLPVELTNFIGRQSEITSVRKALAANRLVTLTGAGGAGKTRLAVHVAADLAGDFSDGVRFIDLAPIAHPDVVSVTAARALGLYDQPDRSTIDTLLRFLRHRQMLLVLDNCEHLLDASAGLVAALLAAAPKLTVLATSRESLGVSGEAIWQVPSLSLADDAIELFADRGRLAKAEFSITDDNASAVTEICRRLDGMPLAIELAAARVRSLSLDEIVDSLHDRFRLLTGGSRTAVRRQQTLRASVDWSHALLTDTERILFRRLAVFLDGFDLDAAQAVTGADGVQRHQVLDQLSLLVDKSLVIAENVSGTTRYRLLETVRQYALEKLGESGEADAVRTRHREYYASMATMLDVPARSDYEQRIDQAEAEIDNLRAAFAWSRDDSDVDQALALSSSLQPLWLARGRIREGWAWFDAALGDLDAGKLEVTAAVHARALVDKALLSIWIGDPNIKEEAERAIALARQIDDPALLARALNTCGFAAAQNREPAGPFFAEASDLARASGDQWLLCQILAWRAYGAIAIGEPIAARATAEEGRDLADAIGDRLDSRQCRYWLANAQLYQGDPAGAAPHFRAIADEAEAAHDLIYMVYGLAGECYALAWHGEVHAARCVIDAALEPASELQGFIEGLAYSALGSAALAAADVALARDACEAAWRELGIRPGQAAVQRAYNAQAALAAGDTDTARRWADDAVSTTAGWHLAVALTTRARVAMGQGNSDQAERDAHEALARAAEVQAYLGISDTLECLAVLAVDNDQQRAARLFGAADAIRQRNGMGRFKIYEADYQSSVAELRDAMVQQDFDAAWGEGAALSIDQAIAYARRGRGERKRPSSGWDSLTPAELDVVRLVCEGLGNKDIAARLFVSPKTVQAHLTHVYTKLGLTSRVQLAQEAARRG